MRPRTVQIIRNAENVILDTGDLLSYHNEIYSVMPVNEWLHIILNHLFYSSVTIKNNNDQPILHPKMSYSIRVQFRTQVTSHLLLNMF